MKAVRDRGQIEDLDQSISQLHDLDDDDSRAGSPLACAASTFLASTNSQPHGNQGASPSSSCVGAKGEEVLTAVVVEAQLN